MGGVDKSKKKSNYEYGGVDKSKKRSNYEYGGSR